MTDGFWPDGYKSCFNLSFDYDSNSALMRRAPLAIIMNAPGFMGSVSWCGLYRKPVRVYA